MGYTHYYYCNPPLSPKKYAAAVADILKVTATTGVPLAGPDGSGKPIFTNDEISFNGVGDEGSYETFSVPRENNKRVEDGKVFGFCKTAHKPYDINVQVSFIVLKHLLGDEITVSSDGEQHEWLKAIQICQKELGYGTDFKIE